MGFWRSDREEVRAKPCVWIKSHGWVVGLLTGLLFLGIGHGMHRDRVSAAGLWDMLWRSPWRWERGAGVYARWMDIG